ncbi:GLPGLI family protein [Flavobacteriales bacterium]|nr:GLPGLI family protein [Flavobacteriales bacterium]
MNHFIKSLLSFFLFLNLQIINGQITHGVILFERKTNLLKKYDSPESQRWLRGEKVKIDRFNLHFSPEKSFFLPIESAVPTKADWATSKNTVIQDFQNKERVSIYNLMGESKFVKDILIERNWKITERKRNIAGYSCRRAIWMKNDSTKIYAWYSDQLIPSTGPETFNGLPGTILGLATEDGGVVYFAKIIKESYQNIDELTADIKMKNYSTEQELKDELVKKSKSNPWMSKVVNYLFEW